MTDPQHAPMATERVAVLLWRYSLPAVVGMVVNALYNVVDRLYIGQGVGPDAMAGLTLTMPYMQVLAAFGMLIGIGSGALVSLRLGQGRQDEAEQVLGQALALIALMTLTVPTAAMLTLDATLRAFGGMAGSIPHARAYLQVILYGSVFTHLSFGLNHIMRAEGSASRAMKAMILGAIANLVLDPLFIFGFGLGIRGAAWATVLAMMLSSLYVLRHFAGAHARVHLRATNLRIRPRLAAAVISIGLSPFILQLVASIVMISYTRSFRQYAGDPQEALNTTAAIGIVHGVLLLLLMPIFGLNGGVQPIIGFNYGAQRYDRVRHAVLLAVQVATIGCFAGWLFVQAAAPWIVRAFTSSRPLLDIGAPALRTMTLALPFLGLPILATTYFQSIGRPSVAILLSLLRQALLLIPLILLLPLRFGIRGIWAAAPISDTLALCAVVPLMLRELRHLERRAQGDRQ